MITEFYGSCHAMLQALEEQHLTPRNMHDRQVPPLTRDTKPPVHITISCLSSGTDNRIRAARSRSLNPTGRIT